MTSLSRKENTERWPQNGHSSHHGHGHHHGGSALGGMVGGLAMGILGGVLMSEMMDALGVDEMIGDAAEALGFDGEDEGEEDEDGFGDFFGSDDEGV